MKLLLDTSVVIALRKGNAKVRHALDSRKSTADEVGISRLTQYELLTGATYLWQKYNDAREVAWLEDLSSWLKVYEVDGEVATAAAEVQAEALARGRPWPDMDLLVALSAKRGSELLTADEDQLAMKAALSKMGVAVSAV